ncbi:hypothetical protein BRD05_03120 [Halobacteriales archaeon QS_9_70_65]|nr:MAG: hypothetical protein BRD05_03120 [Halobacteriales archaeon QS_9_70_65]
MAKPLARARRVVTEVHDEVREALGKKHTPKQVAYSFALGVFITALPTLGTGVLAFFVIAYLFESISKVSLFASVIVLNPVVKWGVYGTSFWVGTVEYRRRQGDIGLLERSYERLFGHPEE